MTAQENPGGWPDAAGLRKALGRFFTAPDVEFILDRISPSIAALVEAARADGRKEGYREALRAECINGSAIDAIRQGLGEVGKRVAFIDDAVAVAIQEAQADGFKEGAEAAACACTTYASRYSKADWVHAQSTCAAITRHIRALPVPTTTQRAGGEDGE